MVSGFAASGITASDSAGAGAKARAAIGAGTVCVWRLASVSAIDYALVRDNCLSGDEAVHAARLHRDRDRRQYIAAHVLMRSVLAMCLDLEARDLHFSANRFGKPRLVALRPAQQLSFNLSHTDGIALFACGAQRAIGVDVERIEASPAAQSARNWLSPGERQKLASLRGMARRRAWYAAWCRKEAWLKARGCGFARRADSIEVELLPDRPARLLTPSVRAWSLHDLDAGPGYAAALAVHGRVNSIAMRDWPE